MEGCFLGGGEGGYLNIRWPIKVTVDALTEYVIPRSYVEWAFLDWSLRKRFVTLQSSMPKFPLEVDASLEKSLAKDVKKEVLKEASPKKVQQSDSTDLGAGGGSPIGRKFGARGSVANATMAGRVQPGADAMSDGRFVGMNNQLTTYLKEITQHGLFLASPELLEFLGPEEETMHPDALGVHDELLRRIPAMSVTVSKRELVSLVLSPGGWVFWSFFTDGYDIGFQVTKNEGADEILPLHRVNCHLATVEGGYENDTEQSMPLQFIFDNSHAKLRKKKLTYKVAVCTKSDLQDAKNSVSARLVEAKEVERRKLFLRNRVASLSKGHSKASLVLLTPSELSVTEEEKALAALERKLDAEKAAKAALQSELEQTQEDLKQTQENFKQETDVTRGLRAELESLKSTLAEERDGREAEQRAAAAAAAEAMNEITALNGDVSAAATHAAEAMNEIEALNGDVASLNNRLGAQEEQSAALEKERNALQGSLTSSETEVARLKAIHAEGETHVAELGIILETLKAKLAEAGSM